MKKIIITISILLVVVGAIGGYVYWSYNQYILDQVDVSPTAITDTVEEGYWDKASLERKDYFEAQIFPDKARFIREADALLEKQQEATAQQ